MNLKLYFDGTAYEGVGYYGYAIEGLLPDGQLTWGCGKISQSAGPVDNDFCLLTGQLIAVEFLRALPHKWNPESDSLHLVRSGYLTPRGPFEDSSRIDAQAIAILESMRIPLAFQVVACKDNLALYYVIRAVEQSRPLPEEVA